MKRAIGFGIVGGLGISSVIVWIVDIVKMFNDFSMGAKEGGDYVVWGLIHLIGVLGPVSWITVWWP